MGRPKKDHSQLTMMEEAYVESLVAMSDDQLVGQYHDAVSVADFRAVTLIASRLAERFLAGKSPVKAA